MDDQRGEAPGVALVTGSAGGLGRACCVALSRRGMPVVAVDIDGDGAERVASELREGGAVATAARVDVVDRHAVDTLVARIVEEHVRLDVVVNLAGVMRNALLGKIENDDFRLVMSSHVEGTLNTMRAATRVMRASGYGRIVNMSSLAARGSVAGSSYGAAKGAIEGLTRAAAMEVARHGITINCVAPGLIEAGMFLTVPQDYRDTSLARVPMQRAGEPEEVGACVAFLASPEASYVTGQTLLVCGGLSLGF